MAIITPDRLKALAPNIKDDRATAYAPALEAALPLGDITTRLRLVHFMAQMAHESGGFRALVENLNYSAQGLLTVFRSRVKTIDKAKELVAGPKEAMAEYVYGNRPSLGNVNPGDGYKYIGRGFMMITGRANYTRYAAMIGQPLVDQPQLLENPVYAAQAAAAFWKTNGINAKADLDDLEGVTRLVNGGTIGLADRQAWLDKAKAAFPPNPTPPSPTPPPPPTPPIVIPDDHLSPHFTLAELTKTQHKEIDNTAPPEIVEILRGTAAQMERVRTLLGNRSIDVNSGYRCKALNDAIQSDDSSAHPKGYAVDFTCAKFGTPLDICRAIAASDIAYDQLIYEKTWVHISFEPKPMRMQKKITQKVNGKTHYPTVDQF